MLLEGCTYADTGLIGYRENYSSVKPAWMSPNENDLHLPLWMAIICIDGFYVFVVYGFVCGAGAETKY